METTVKKTVTVETIVRVPVEKAWMFWTTPDHIIQWNNASEDFRLRDIARATSAAPTYFPPAIIESLDANYRKDQRRHALVDGGVFANDPAALARAEAQRLFPRADRALVVSLGTGARVNRINGDKAVGFGLAGWLPSLIDVFMDGASALTEHELMPHPPSPGCRSSARRCSAASKPRAR